MKWKIISKRPATDLIKTLLANRGLKTKKEIEAFLHPPKPESLTAKHLAIAPVQLIKAVARIKKAVKDKEKIIVYGDYDADGICATAILWETLYKLGASAMPFIPSREEGYGMKVDRIEQFSKEGIGLIVTVDQGIVAFEAAAEAKTLKIDLIITDHHLPEKKKPAAKAIIHTTQLSGAGVAWYLAKSLGAKAVLDLATIGTVGDIVPLKGANRSLVKYGLAAVRQTARPGLRSLFRVAGIESADIGPYEIGFLIGPRLNASGRMDDPVDSLRLVCTPNAGRADELAQKLNLKNKDRQLLMASLTIKAKELWLKEDGKSSLIFVSHESFQQGVVGLVAGKLMEEFHRPVVIVALGKEFSRASARSIEEFNIVKAVRACADLLGSHGGHPRAAGFTIATKNIAIMRRRLIAIAEKKLKGRDLSPTLKIDLEIDLESLNLGLYRRLANLEPFGEGNPQPVFATRQVKIVDARTVGADGRHLKLKVESCKSKVIFDAIAFGLGHLYPQLSSGKLIDIAYNLELNEWSGHQKLQLKIKDVKF